MAYKRDRIRTLDVDSEDSRPTSLPPGRPRRRFPAFTVTVLLALCGLVALAPTVISWTPLGPQIVASAAQGRINGQLAVKSVGLGWVSPVTLRGVVVQDDQGHVVATAESLVVGKSLLGLLTDANNLGTITIDKAQLLLVVRPDGSNLEDLLAPQMNQPSSGASPTVTVDVRDAQVKLVDGSTDQAWEFSPVAAHIESPRGAERAWKVAAEAKLGESRIKANLAHVLGDDSETDATVEADRFPLEPLQPILTRVLGQVRLGGSISGKVGATLAEGGQRQSVSFENLEAVQLHFAAAQYLSKDAVRLEKATANGTAQLADGVWQLRDLDLRSEVAALAGSGDVRVSGFSSAAAIPPGNCEIGGVVDLARLLQMLPNTLRARPGVQLTSGEANISLVGSQLSGSRRFELSLDTKEVRAVNNGRPVELSEPVHFDAVVLETPQGWQIEQLDAKSSFLTAKATGTPSQGRLTVEADMSRLAAELDQFVDLGDVRMVGRLAAAVNWQQEQAGTTLASGQANLKAFELAAPGMLPWREENLVVKFQAQGLSMSPAYGLGGGKLEVISADDILEVAITKPVRAISASTPLPLDVGLRGDLATWTARLQAVVPLHGWRLSGPVVIACKANASTTSIDVPDATVHLRDLRAAGSGLNVFEPELKGRLSASYDLTSGATTLAGVEVQGTSLALGADKLVVQTGQDAKITGDLAARGDLSSIMNWLADPRVPPTSQLHGEAEAEANFTYEGGMTKARLSGKIVNLTYAVRDLEALADSRPAGRQVSAEAPWETKWTEPIVQFGGQASYDGAKGIVSLEQMEAAADKSKVIASGSISELATRCQLDLKGEVKYDLATWTPKVQAVLGHSFDMYGVSTKAFEVHGPLFDPSSSQGSVEGEAAPLLPLALTGKAGIGWQGMQWMALEVGPAEVAAELKDSTIFVQPTRIPLSQGTLQLAPAVVLRGSNWLVSHEQGRVIDQVVVTPQMCSAWLKYIQPLLADATEAQGKFSVDVQNASIPISQPKTFDAKGTFVMHNVSVGPGPLARELLGVAQQVKDFTDGKLGLEGLAGIASRFGAGGAQALPQTSGKQWLEFPEQDVPVEVVEGRVYHENLTMHHKEFTLRTTGSVGINDQTVQLVCDIPIADKWIEGKSYLAGLKGKSLKIPVGGTITNPRLDAGAWAKEMKTLAYSSVGGAIQGGLSGALNPGTGGGVQDEIIKGQNQIQDEIQKGQTKVQDELNKGKQKLEDELRNGLKGIFGR